MKLYNRYTRRILLAWNDLYYSVVPAKVECNICHHRGNRLHSDTWHLYSICPKCGLGVRHRLLCAAMTLLDNFSTEKLVRDKKVLHFAPETFMKDLFKEKASVYHTADFIAPGYVYDHLDYNIDMSDMPVIPDGSYDCVVACDVLEHIPDDRKAIREAYRVLRPGGMGIFTVPQKDNLEQTHEDLSVTDPKQREMLFGQYDHLRIYGHDVAERLGAEGFEVSIVDDSFFDKKTATRNVLFPPVLSANPLATNYRKIFFCKKP